MLLWTARPHTSVCGGVSSLPEIFQGSELGVGQLPEAAQLLRSSQMPSWAYANLGATPHWGSQVLI